MSEDEANGLIHAYSVAANGDARRLAPHELDQNQTEGYRWIHLDLRSDWAKDWLETKSGLSEIALEALVADETRPRTTAIGGGLLVILRGVNFNPGSDPEDMVAIRLFVEDHRVITIRRRKLRALADLRQAFESGTCPTTVGEFVCELADHLIDRMGSVIGELDEGLDDVEEETSVRASLETRSRLVDLRRTAIGLRRYLAPQRDALASLATQRLPWIGEEERVRLREVLDRTMHYVEDLEAARERAAVTHEEISGHLAEQLNQRMYALSIIAGIFLPLSFATGLLGINVGGIPGAQTPEAFGIFCLILGALVVVEVLIFRRLKWL